MEKFFEEMWVDIPALEDPTKEGLVFRTVIHGDAHVSNMMFSSIDPNAQELRLTCFYRDIW